MTNECPMTKLRWNSGGRSNRLWALAIGVWSFFHLRWELWRDLKLDRAEAKRRRVGHWLALIGHSSRHLPNAPAQAGRILGIEFEPYKRKLASCL